MTLYFILSLFAIPALGQFSGSCAWDDFSLVGAQGYEIQCIDGQYAYGYTPCMSYALCQGQRYQSVYFSRTNGQCQYYLAEWDDGATVPRFRRNDGIYTWTFHYENGGQCSGGGSIKFDIEWQCDETAQPFSLQTTCGKIDDDECQHTMQIKSVYACIEGVEIGEGGSSVTDGLSTGSLVLILAMVAFILYCAIGYGINTYRTEERDWKQVKQHTPQYEFWTYGLCAYTKAGCLVSYEWLREKTGKKDEKADTNYTLDEEDEYE